jgi:hypothetical protein
VAKNAESPWPTMFQREMEFERAFVKGGGTLLAGLDPTGIGGVIAGFGDLREVELLVESGFTPLESIKIATLNGAQFLEVDKQVGSLTPGKQADIVLLKTDVINTAPVLDPKGTIVTFADTSNVDSVYVAGNAVKRGGQLLGVDMKSVVGKLEESRNHILSAGGLLPDWCAEHAATA